MSLPFLGRPGRLQARAGTTAAPNPPPADITLSASSIAYTATSGAVVGVLSVTDPGDTAWRFEIVGGSGKWALSNSTAVATVQLLRGLSGTLTAGVNELVQIRAIDSNDQPFVKDFAISVTDPVAPFTMPIGLRNYGGSSVAAGNVVQFGVPIDQARQIAPASLTLALTRDSDSASIPVQMDLTSTTRTGGHLAYAVCTAKLPFAIAAGTTIPCTLTVTPGATYSPGVDIASAAQLEARDFNVTCTGDNVTTLAVASFNDYVYRRKIMAGGVVTGWEGWSRFKEAGSPAGQWCVRWRAIAKGNASLADWTIEASVYCCSVTFETTFPSISRGRTGSFALRAGAAALNDNAAFSGVFVSGNTGFALYQSGDITSFAHGGATLRPVHDRNYVTAVGGIWPFAFTADDDDGVTNALGSFEVMYAPGGLGGYMQDWGAGGIWPTIGPVAGVSYNMLRNTSDDAKWQRGFSAGLKTQSISFHAYDPATGFHRPRFGSYAGMGAFSETAEGSLNTYDAAGAIRMRSEAGHMCDTAFVPGLLTGRMAFIDGLTMPNNLISTSPVGYRRPQCTGRPRREHPWITPATTLTRYWCWPWRQVLHMAYLADDGRPDKAYTRAQCEQTQLWCQDLLIDKLPWTSQGVGVATTGFVAAYNGNAAAGPYPLRLFQANSNYGGIDAGDPAWSVDFNAYMDFLAYRRNGEAWIRDVYDAWFTPYNVGRSFGDGACPAYAAPFYGVAQYAGSISQTWTDWWSRSGDGAYKATCPSTMAIDSGGYSAKYQQVASLLDSAGFSGAHGRSYRDVVEVIGAVYGGSTSAVVDGVGARWIMGTV